MTKLNKKIIIEGTIKALTGLHIGGTNSAMGIGGPDSMVVRNPLDNKPYIPGSSLKGKLRAMLDIADGTINKNKGAVENGTSQNPKDASVKLFGNAPTGKDKDEKGEKFKQFPSRVIVRDCELKGTDDELDKQFKNTDLPFSESKTEVVIDRITAKAMPRQLERVPAGAKFKMNLVVNVFDESEQEYQLKNLARAMRLLMDDYLGGNGSRGYGQIEIQVEKVSERSIEFYIGEKEENEITETFKNYLSNGK